MPIDVRATATDQDTSNASLVLTPSSAIQANDVVFIFVATANDSQGAFPTVAISGFTEIATINQASNWASLKLFRKVAGGSEPGRTP